MGVVWKGELKKTRSLVLNSVRPNNKISVSGMKILGRLGTYYFCIILFSGKRYNLIIFFPRKPEKNNLGFTSRFSYGPVTLNTGIFIWPYAGTLLSSTPPPLLSPSPNRLTKKCEKLASMQYAN